MTILLIIVAWVIGIFAGAMFLIPPMIILFFGIPFTLQLKRMGAMNGNGPIPSYLGSLVIMPIIFGLITWGVYSWLPGQLIAYWVGVGFILLTGISKCGRNPANMSDYLQSNAKFLDQNTLDNIHAQYGTNSP